MLSTGDCGYLSTGVSPRDELKWGSPPGLPVTLRNGTAFWQPGLDPARCPSVLNSDMAVPSDLNPNFVL